MGGQLRVNPEHLRSTATAQAEVGAFLATMQPGAPVAAAAGGMAGLLTEGACQVVSAAFDSAANTVKQELTDHADKLTTSANRYGHIDEELGRRLRKFSQ